MKTFPVPKHFPFHKREWWHNCTLIILITWALLMIYLRLNVRKAGVKHCKKWVLRGICINHGNHAFSRPKCECVNARVTPAIGLMDKCLNMQSAFVNIPHVCSATQCHTKWHPTQNGAQRVARRVFSHTPARKFIYFKRRIEIETYLTIYTRHAYSVTCIR